MSPELVWTVIFGFVATAIGLVTIWQNAQALKVKIESKYPLSR